MEKRIKLPRVDFEKICNILVETGKNVTKYVDEHKTELLTGAFLTAVADNIRVRFARKKDQRAAKESIGKQQQIMTMHEAEIKVLKMEADRAQEAQRKVDLLEQMILNTTEDGGDD